MFEKKTAWVSVGEMSRAEPIDVFSKEPDPNGPSPRFVRMFARREVRLPGFKQAKMLLSADDYYKLYINGTYVCEGPAPGYPSSYYVNEVDVTPFLKKGKNTIALDVYYQGLINRVWVSGDLRQGFICELSVDGKTLLRSDENWHYICPSSRTQGEIYGYDTQATERIDLRSEPKNWKNNDFDDSVWPRCAARTTADYKFIPQEIPVPKAQVLTPQLLRRDENRELYDFGREIVGVPVVKVSGTEAGEVLIRCAEELGEDGRALFRTRCGCIYEDSIVLNGETNEVETYDYKGFRYIEVEAGEGAQVLSVSARAIAQPYDENAFRFKTDEKALADIIELTRYTLVTAVQHGFVDCPTREKGQYSGDLIVAGTAYSYVTGDTKVLKKALLDWGRSAFINKALMSEFPCSLHQQIADYSLLYPYALLKYYELSGDRELLMQGRETAERMMDVFASYERADGLIENVSCAWNLIDWPVNLRDDYNYPTETPCADGCHNVINALYIGAKLTMDKIREILGIREKSTAAESIVRFNEVFLDRDTGLYVDAEGSSHSALHSNMYPAFFGFVEAGSRQSVGDFLVNKGLSCGVWAAFFALKALCAMGRYDAAFSLMTGSAPHSWGNMLRDGATTLFEAWGKEDKWNTSLCHPWAAAPVIVLIEDILGIGSDALGGGRWVCRLPGSVQQMELCIRIRGKKLRFLRAGGLSTLTEEGTEA